MKKRTIIGGMICGLICAMSVLLYTALVYKNADAARVEAMERYGGEQVEVLVATRDIYPGETLDSTNTSTKLWVSDLLPEGSVVNVRDALGKQLTSLLLAGEAVSTKRFEAEALAIEIPEGLVALSVPAQEVQTVGGALSSGSLVDVYAVGTQATRLGQSILVLATSAGDAQTKGNSKITWVTLAVPPEKTQEFVVASQSMDIYFTLPAVSPVEKSNDVQVESLSSSIVTS